MRPYLLRKYNMVNEPIEKPFSQAYVLRVTTKHMRRSVDISIRKTFERIKDFAGNQEKSTEIFNTLAQLHSLREGIDRFQISNQEIFKG